MPLPNNNNMSRTSPNVWASGQNLEECRERLQDNLEYEMLVTLTEQRVLPDFGETTLNLDKIDQPTDAEKVEYQALSSTAKQQGTISLKSILPTVSSSA